MTYALGVLLVAGMFEYRLRTATVEDAPVLAWTGANGIRRLTLHASDDGRPLYQLYGFKGTNEMRLDAGGRE